MVCNCTLPPSCCQSCSAFINEVNGMTDNIYKKYVSEFPPVSTEHLRDIIELVVIDLFGGVDDDDET